MTAKEKRELIILLSKYQNELLSKVNTTKCNHGIKAQYNHARIIMNKLSVERDNEMIPYFNHKIDT